MGNHLGRLSDKHTTRFGQLHRLMIMLKELKTDVALKLQNLLTERGYGFSVT
jgi:hypothetical protein